MKNLGGVVFITLAVAVISSWNAVYTVSEVQQAIITQFGKPVGAPITTAG